MIVIVDSQTLKDLYAGPNELLMKFTRLHKIFQCGIDVVSSYWFGIKCSLHVFRLKQFIFNFLVQLISRTFEKK